MMGRRRKKKQQDQELSPKKPPLQNQWDKWAYIGLAAVLLLCLSLSLPGISWARCGKAIWYQDVIEGEGVVREMPRVFGQWTYKYPRLQFAIDSAFYKLMIMRWEKDPVNFTDANGRVQSSVLNGARLDKLAIISRTTSLLMGLGVVAAVYCCSMFWFGDWLAAVLAALCMSLTQLFIFHNHISSVDGPTLFWFTWGIYWLLKAVKIGKWHHYLLMGVFFSLCMCTKDGVIGFVLGIIPAFWLVMIGHGRQEGKTLKSSAASIFSLKVLLAIISFLLVYAFLQDILTSPQAFFKRISIWSPSGHGVADYNKDFKGHWPLLQTAFFGLYTAFGWPLLALVFVSVAWFTYKYRWWSSLVTVPIIVFYVAVTMNTKFISPRYLMPGFPALVMCTGGFCAWLFRNKKIPAVVSYVLVGVVLLLSLFYCVALDLEMVNDPRIRTEKWFAKNAPPGASVASVLRSAQLAPRLDQAGFRHNPQWGGLPVEFAKANLNYLPDYIILTRKWQSDVTPYSQEFWQAVADGELGYTSVAWFGAKYMIPKKHFLCFAGWPKCSPGKMNVPMFIYKKNGVEPK